MSYQKQQQFSGLIPPTFVMNASIAEKLKTFKNDCLTESHDSVVQRHLLDGSSFYFETTEPTAEFTFKKGIADSLQVHIRDIAIVGSAKLGFSIKPEKTGLYAFRHFDLGRTSDIDIAVVSSTLFDLQVIKLYEHTSAYRNSHIWRVPSDKKSFINYAVKGWLRPDFLPTGYHITTEITPTLAEYKMKFGRSINIGIYKSWYFFQKYHSNNVRSIHLNIIAS